MTVSIVILAKKPMLVTQAFVMPPFVNVVANVSTIVLNTKVNNARDYSSHLTYATDANNDHAVDL